MFEEDKKDDVEVKEPDTITIPAGITNEDGVPPEVTEQAEKPKSNRKKLIAIIIAVVMMVLVGISAALIVVSDGASFALRKKKK